MLRVRHVANVLLANTTFSSVFVIDSLLLFILMIDSREKAVVTLSGFM